MKRNEKDTLVDFPTGGDAVVRDVDVGSVVGDYRIESFVAKGGFATVFRGRSLSKGDVVAIKVLRPELVKSSVALARFRREAEMLERLKHPNIVNVHAIDEADGGIPYLVMEWIAGHTLSDELRKRGTFSPEEMLGVLEPLCNALSAAHALGVVHRDLKPSNVMVIPQGDWLRVKLVDFGIAKLLEPETEANYTSLTATGTFLGSPSYMAPEQFVGLRVDVRTDVYALAIVSHLLLAGKLPFRAASPMEMAEMHQSAKPPPMSSVSRAPVALDAVFARALAKMPAARHESVQAFLEDVRQVLKPSAEKGNSLAQGWIFLHVVAHVDPAQEDIDEALAEIDEALNVAERALEAAGMTVQAEGGQGILGTCECIPERMTSCLREVLVLHAKLTRLFTRIQVAMTVHKAVDKEAGKALRWTAKSPWGAVSATPEALQGIERQFEIRAIDGIANKVRVVACLEAEPIGRR